MKKPDSLRQHLMASVPGLSLNPDCVKVRVEGGSLRSTAGNGLSFAYKYNLVILLTDYAGSPDLVAIPLLDWIRIHQHELLANQDKHAESIKIELDILDNDKVDLELTVPVTERVIVKREGGQLHYSYPPEPQQTDHWPGGPMQLLANGEVVAAWVSGAPLGTELETPHPVRRPCGC